MPGLDELKVSLTKNGYYKVAEVLKLHPRSEVLDNISATQFRDCLEGDRAEIEAPPDAQFSDDVVAVSARLLVALAAKPFAIVAGTAGTGKHGLCANAFKNFALTD